jgi:hypothetical protein
MISAARKEEHDARPAWRWAKRQPITGTLVEIIIHASELDLELSGRHVEPCEGESHHQSPDWGLEGLDGEDS